MFPETEAQKVIAISLGKIAVSRSQRGGPKLFKNLLVANVIQKARYVVLDETAQQYRSRYEQSNNDGRTEQWEAAYSNNLTTDIPTEHVSLNCGSELMTNDFARPTASRDMDEAQTTVVSTDMDISDNCGCWDEQNKENVLPNSENTERTVEVCSKSMFAGEKLYYSSSVSLPSRCVKRRSSTSEDMFTPHSTKRARKELKSPRQGWRRSDSSADVENDSEDLGGLVSQSIETYRDIIEAADEQMDLEQISSLVSVFSSSFKGLVDNPTPNASTGSELTGFYCDKTSLRRGPDVGAAVCSKQAGSVFTMRQSSFETSSPPIVALTV